MDRVIRFRGRDVFTGKWVYGDLVHNLKITRERDLPRVMVGGYEVDEKTIGQFTGLHDRNGKEIYEGDVVTFMRKPAKGSFVLVLHVVKCYDVCNWVFEPLQSGVLGMCMINHSDSDSHKFEVVGNIFENNFKKS